MQSKFICASLQFGAHCLSQRTHLHRVLSHADQEFDLDTLIRSAG